VPGEEAAGELAERLVPRHRRSGWDDLVDEHVRVLRSSHRAAADDAAELGEKKQVTERLPGRRKGRPLGQPADV